MRAFESTVSAALDTLVGQIANVPPSTLTYIAKPDRYIDPKLISLLPLVMGRLTSASGGFLNCFSLEFAMDKAITCKIFNNGTLQITGCKTKKHPIFICKKIQAFLDCVYTISLAMENVYYSLNLEVDKSRLYEAWRLNGGLAAPPVGSYTAVRLRALITDFVKTDYFVLNSKVFAMIGHKSEPSVVNIAVFHNGKLLFSGLNRSCIMAAAKKFTEFACRNKHIFIQRVCSFC